MTGLRPGQPGAGGGPEGEGGLGGTAVTQPNNMAVINTFIIWNTIFVCNLINY